MESIKKFWNDALEVPEVKWVLLVAGLAIGVVVAFYCVKLFRDMAIGGAPADPVNLVSDFQKLRDQGKLDQQEYEKLAKVIPKPMLPNAEEKSEESD